MERNSSDTLQNLIQRIWSLLRRLGGIFFALVRDFCSLLSCDLTDPHPGQVYYALLQEREAKGIKDIAISRVEQISPLPYDQVCTLLT
jgi:hypothetical protein